MVDLRGGKTSWIFLIKDFFYFISCVLIQFTVEAQFMNAECNLEFPNFVSLSYCWYYNCYQDTITVIKSPTRMYNDF